jgi:hypothetical protein
MVRLFLFAILLYLLYLVVLKPILGGYREAPRGRKGNAGGTEKDRIGSDKGEYIDYDEIK